jgi:hypothetical protein
MRLALALVLVSAFAACAGPSHQEVPMPDRESAVSAGSTRIYVGRRDQTSGSWRNVRVFDNDREIGVLHDDEFLCWDRPAKRGVARIIFEGVGFDMDHVESMCELPAEPGGTVYLGITIDREGHKPLVERIEEKEAREALKKRSPASTAKD